MAIPANYQEISIESLPELSARLKAEGHRFVQVLAVNTEAGIDVQYTFMKDGVLEVFTIKGVQKGMPIPSITDNFIAAFVFENEIHDLFGVEIRNIAIYFKGNFYAVSQRDIDSDMFAYIKQVLAGIIDEYKQIVATLLTDTSVKNRLVGVGYISHDDAVAQSLVGPFGRASGVNYDVRMLGNGAYGKLSDFQPVLDNDGDCYARVKVRCQEVLQSIDIINEMIDTIPAGDIAVKVKGNPTAGAEACNVLEQPRGECYYYARGNGTKYLERMRMRTPTSQNLAGMTLALKGCDLADVNNIVLTIDPCISCTER